MSKYKVGDKVVMEILRTDDDGYYEFGNDNRSLWWFGTYINEISEPLSTYTEPLEAKIRRQAAEITRLLAENERLKPNYENIRAKGQNEAWELARKIVLPQSQGGMNDEDYMEVFGSGVSAPYIMNNFTYPEAAAKVSQWEKAKEEICVGDVVRFKNNNRIEFCVTEIDLDGLLYGIGKDGAIYSDKSPEDWEKTGRHIDIDGFLKQIGGE